MTTTDTSSVTFPDGSVATTETEVSLHYVNAFGEEMRLTGLDPESEIGQVNYSWRAEHKSYKDVRWETRVVTRTESPWQPVE